MVLPQIFGSDCGRRINRRGGDAAISIPSATSTALATRGAASLALGLSKDVRKIHVSDRMGLAVSSSSGRGRWWRTLTQDLSLLGNSPRLGICRKSDIAEISKVGKLIAGIVLRWRESRDSEAVGRAKVLW